MGRWVGRKYVCKYTTRDERYNGKWKCERIPA